MAVKNCELRLLNNDEKILCRIEAITYFDEENEFDVGETFYIHPLTGSQCQTIEQTIQGWSEQNPIYQEQWDNLIKQVNNDMDFEQKIWDLDVVEYYQ